MTVKLKNTSGEAIYLGSPLTGGRRVEAGEVVEVDGTLAPKKDQPEDATVVKVGDDDARAYPHTVWTVSTAKENS